jgi:hypothetical protein
MEDRPPSALFMRIFMAAYFCAGVGYVVSATFIVAIVDRLPGLAGLSGGQKVEVQSTTRGSTKSGNLGTFVGGKVVSQHNPGRFA